LVTDEENKIKNTIEQELISEDELKFEDKNLDEEEEEEEIISSNKNLNWALKIPKIDLYARY
jgi:hypothetical protein